MKLMKVEKLEAVIHILNSLGIDVITAEEQAISHIYAADVRIADVSKYIEIDEKRKTYGPPKKGRGGKVRKW